MGTIVQYSLLVGELMATLETLILTTTSNDIRLQAELRLLQLHEKHKNGITLSTTQNNNHE